MKKDRKGEFCVWAHLDKKSLLAVEELKIRANEFLTGPYFGAHLTLVGQIQSINKRTEEALLEISKNFTPLVLATEGIHMKNKFFQALFIKIESGKQLNSLRNQILKDLNLESKEFFPHVSLYYGLESETIKNSAKKQIPPCPKELIINRISLVDTTQNIEFWNEIETYPLDIRAE